MVSLRQLLGQLLRLVVVHAVVVALVADFPGSLVRHGLVEPWSDHGAHPRHLPPGVRGFVQVELPIHGPHERALSEAQVLEVLLQPGHRGSVEAGMVPVRADLALVDRAITGKPVADDGADGAPAYLQDLLDVVGVVGAPREERDVEKRRRGARLVFHLLVHCLNQHAVRQRHRAQLHREVAQAVELLELPLDDRAALRLDPQ
mmetsp:Transcript_92118/g.199164  ORF Transcript_92118/g.199164 Transcript_92118/m.199164 type:complete len:203 (+) Transcript_92118:854-1462(+)